MIIYIHGFGSHGYGAKANMFRAYFSDKEETFVAPSLSYIPDLAMQTLEELVQVCEDVKLIGSSLGAYYALYLAEKYDLKAVLINPAMHSYKTLGRVLGNAEHFFDASHFEWKRSHLEMLKKYKMKNLDQSTVMLLVQKGDEVLDYREAVLALPKVRKIVEEGGNHSFLDIKKHFDEIRAFLN